MRRIRIVSDSSSDITSLNNAEFGFAPMKIITAEREFVDDEGLDAGEMAAFFTKYKGKSKTSCPNPEDWIKAFDGADDIICVTITGALSGSFNSACAAAKIYEAENEGKRVFVIDTLSAGPEVTLIVRKLEELVSLGLGYEEICKKITEYKDNTALLFMLKSLKNFASNGRVSPIIAKIVGIAGICIVGRASSKGTLDPAHKCRGEARSVSKIIEELKENGLSEGRVSIGHARNEEAASRLKSLINDAFPRAEVEIHRLRGLCSFYAEDGGMLVGYEKR